MNHQLIKTDVTAIHHQVEVVCARLGSKRKVCMSFHELVIWILVVPVHVALPLLLFVISWPHEDSPVQEGGGLCILLADRCCCMEEASTTCEAIILQLK